MVLLLELAAQVKVRTGENIKNLPSNIVALVVNARDEVCHTTIHAYVSYTWLTYGAVYR